MSRESAVREISQQVERELLAAMDKFGPFNSNHEGLAVIEEEVFELKLEVYKNDPHEANAAMRAEAIQIAAMAMRFVYDLIY